MSIVHPVADMSFNYEDRENIGCNTKKPLNLVDFYIISLQRGIFMNFFLYEMGDSGSFHLVLKREKKLVIILQHI